jgi:RND family efflux transporter MFP subunit
MPPGSVEAFELVELHPGVSGYLKTQTVDYGSRVKKGDVLAVLDVPDLEKQVQRDEAALLQAHAKVDQMGARVASARAEVEAARAGVTQAEAAVKSKAAARRLAQMRLNRYSGLVDQTAIEPKLQEEAQEQRDAAVEAENAAVAAVAYAKAQVTSAAAKVKQAEADVAEAEAEVRVARADLDKARVLVGFATVTAPFDGIVTRRTLFPNDYVRAPREGGTGLPLLTVARTDKVRVVVQVPDRNVPYTQVGAEAIVRVDALDGEKFKGKVARMSGSEDAQTRMMHVEIDLDNPPDKDHPAGRINPGMFGHVQIKLRKDADTLSVPSSCLAGKSEDGKATLCVVRDGRVRHVQARVGVDNGVRVAVLEGLRADDQVLTSPGGLADGTPVTPVEADNPASR